MKRILKILATATIQENLENIVSVLKKDESLFEEGSVIMNVDFQAPARIEHTEVNVAQACPTLCDPMDYMVHGILQARMLEWVAFPFTRGSSQPRDRTQVSRIAGGFSTS